MMRPLTALLIATLLGCSQNTLPEPPETSPLAMDGTS